MKKHSSGKREPKISFSCVMLFDCADPQVKLLGLPDYIHRSPDYTAVEKAMMLQYLSKYAQTLLHRGYFLLSPLIILVHQHIDPGNHRIVEDTWEVSVAEANMLEKMRQVFDQPGLMQEPQRAQSNNYPTPNHFPYETHSRTQGTAKFVTSTSSTAREHSRTKPQAASRTPDHSRSQTKSSGYNGYAVIVANGHAYSQISFISSESGREYSGLVKCDDGSDWGRPPPLPEGSNSWGEIETTEFVGI